MVTGAGRGIGAGIARLFAAQGAAVVVNDLGVELDGSGADKGPAGQVVQQITDAGGAAIADGGDISDPEQAEGLVRTAIEEFGKLDVLVNVAGILRDRMIFNLGEQEWDDVIRVHLKGHYNTTKPAAAYWRDQRNPDGHYRGIVGLTYSAPTRWALRRHRQRDLARRRHPDDRVDPSERLRPRDDDERSPDNIAPIVVHRERGSDWLTGRSSAPDEVHLYNKPAPVRHVVSDGPWDPDRLADLVERTFKPAVAADGR